MPRRRSDWDVENQKQYSKFDDLVLRTAGRVARGTGRYLKTVAKGYAGLYAADYVRGRITNSQVSKMSPPSIKRRKMSRNPKYQKKRGRSSGKVARGGIGTGKRIKSKSRRKTVRKKSLKKRVRALERDGPKESKVWALETSLWRAENSTICNTSYYEFPMIQLGIISSAVAELTGNIIQSSCRVENMRATLELKNNITSNCEVEYQLFKCKGNTPGGPLAALKESLELYAKIGTAIVELPDLIAGTPHDGTSVRTPTQLALGGTEQHAPLWSGNRRDVDWAPTGPIRRAKVGPGDTLSITYNMGGMTYDVDKLGQADAGTLFHKGIDVFCIVRLRGALGHDTGVNQGNVGWGEHRMDAMLTQSTRVKNMDGEGTNILVYNQADDATGLTDIEFADDRGGAFIQTAKPLGP